MKEILSAFYRDFHRINGRYGFVHHLTNKARYFTEQIGRNKRVLDLGCRDGAAAKIFSSGNNLTCLDVDLEACNLCHASLGVEVIWHDLNEPLPLSNDSYDVVVLSDVLEHVFLVESLVSEISRVLTSGGIFLGSTPNAYYWSNRWKMMRGLDLAEYNDATHVHYFSLASLKNLLGKTFSEVEIKPYGKNRFAGVRPTMFASDFFWKSINN